MARIFFQEPALHSTIVPDCGFRRHLRFELIVTEVRQRGIHPYREILKWPTRDLVGIFDLFGSEVRTSLRDPDPEERTDVQFGCDFNFSMMQSNDMLDQGESDADAFLRRVVVSSLVKTFEDPGLFIPGYSDSIIFHRNGYRQLLLFTDEIHFP